MRFKAAISKSDESRFQIADVVLGPLRKDEVLVRIVATGICHTDAICHEGHVPIPKPIILGHEGAGIVERIGADVGDLKPGDHVCLTFNSCGECSNCKDSAPFYCEYFFPANILGRRLDGSTAITQDNDVTGDAAISAHFFGQSSFAEYSVANRNNVIKVPHDVPLDMLGPLGCGIQTGAGAVWNVLKTAREDRLAIFGVGTVGLSAIMAARISQPAMLIAVDPNPIRRALALELGATHAVDPTQAQFPGWFDAHAGRLTQAIDTTGNPEVVKSIVNSLGTRGTLILLGAAAQGTELRFDLMHMLNNGITIKSVIEGESNSRKMIPHLIGLYQQGQFPFDRILRFYDFADIDIAMADHLSGETIKPILRIGNA